MKTLRIRIMAVFGVWLSAAAFITFAADQVTVVQSPPLVMTNQF